MLHRRIEAVDDVLLDLGSTDADAVQEIRDPGVLAGCVDDEFGGHHLEIAVLADGNPDDRVVGAIVDQVADFRLVAEVDPRLVVKATSYAPFQ